MTSYTTAKAKTNFDKIVEDVANNGEPARITRGRKTVCAVVAAEDYEYLQRIRAAEDAEDIREADKVMREYERTGEAISLEELEKELNER